jgi:hypothetical protein
MTSIEHLYLCVAVVVRGFFIVLPWLGMSNDLINKMRLWNTNAPVRGKFERGSFIFKLQHDLHISNTSIATVQGLKNVNQKVWEELITQSRCRLFKTCWKNYLVQLRVNFSKNVRTLPKSHTHIFNMSMTTVQGLKNVSLKVWGDFITQNRCFLFKTWLNDLVQLHVNFLKNVWILPKRHMYIFNMSIITVQCLMNINLKGWEELITQSRYPIKRRPPA